MTVSANNPQGTLAVVPGSFDPITLGHVDIIGRAAQAFDRVTVLVTVNPSKSGMFEESERVSLVHAAVKETLPEVSEKISVETCHGLLADYLQSVQANAIVKGLRSVQDYEYEFPMTHMNKKLSGVDSFFLLTNPHYSFISSTLVKEVAKFGGDVTPWLSPTVAQRVQEKLG